MKGLKSRRLARQPSRASRSEWQEPRVRVTSSGGRYVDPDELIRSPFLRDLLKKDLPIIRARETG